MTPERLAEIRACCEKATPGPWYPQNDYYGYGILFNNGNRVGVDFDKQDREFIAMSREAVPELIREIEWLQAEVEQLASDNAGLSRDLIKALK